MAIINGTQFADFIHRAGDGQTGPGNEISTVTAGNDTITAAAGNDLVYADGGNDLVQGDTGADTLHGGAGNDLLYNYFDAGFFEDGDAGDQLLGEDGDDFLALGSGDSGNGGTGNDTIEVYGNNPASIIGGSGLVDTLRVGDGIAITTAAISGIERLEATNGAFGTQLTAAQFNSFATIGAIGGGNQVVFTLTGGGTASNLAFDPAITNVIINGSAGTESLTMAAASTARLDYRGGTGAATVAGRSAADLLQGGDGADTLQGGAGNDLLYNYFDGGFFEDGDAGDQLLGEDGDDFLVLGSGDSGNGGIGNDTIQIFGDNPASVIGGSGIDTLRVGDGIAITTAAISGIERLEATNGAFGTQLTAAQFNSFAIIGAIGGGNQVVFTLTGGGTASNLAFDPAITNVIINGSAGTESLTMAAGSTARLDYRGGTGAATVVGGGGGDTLQGGNGADTLQGGAGNDLLYNYFDGGFFEDGDAGDQLLGEDGNDFLALGAGDSGNGGTGNDTIDAVGAAALTAGDGNDLLIGSAGNDSFDGGTGIDTVSYQRAGSPVIVSLAIAGAQATGGGGTDILAGIENLIGGNGSDQLTGSSGNNVLAGAGGNDTLTGGAGNDTADYSAAGSALTVDLRIATQQNTGGAGLDTLNTIENLLGSAHNDTLTGNAAANIIEGGAGDDLIDGQGGSDTASYASAGGGVTVSLAIAGPQNTRNADIDTLTGFERLTGSRFADSLTGDAAANTLNGGQLNDVLMGGDGDDLLNGQSGRDTASYASAGAAVNVSLTVTGAQNTGGAGIDTLTGIEWLAGSGFADSLTGDAAANFLNGNGGNDILSGGGGGDKLQGGAGNDTMTGGQDADSFVFNRPLNAVANVDNITDFTVIDDTIQLDNAIFTGLSGAVLDAAAFHIGASAADASDRVIYNAATGALFFDVDGAGGAAQIRFATLAAGLGLTNADFLVV